jgi:hypothetical protein
MEYLRERMRKILLGIGCPCLDRNHCDRLDPTSRQKFGRRGGLLCLRRLLCRVSYVSPGNIRDCETGGRGKVGWVRGEEEVLLQIKPRVAIVGMTCVRVGSTSTHRRHQLL